MSRRVCDDVPDSYELKISTARAPKIVAQCHAESAMTCRTPTS
jgi:hypothetical protein